MEQNSQKVIRRRLSRIEGQIRGLIQMIEDDRDCKDLLIQLSAVRAALDSVGSLVISDHVEELTMSTAFTPQSRQEISQLIKTFLK